MLPKTKQHISISKVVQNLVSMKQHPCLGWFGDIVGVLQGSEGTLGGDTVDKMTKNVTKHVLCPYHALSHMLWDDKGFISYVF